jgi:hypothetical protein
MPRFEYGTARLKDFRVVASQEKSGKANVEAVLLRDEPLRPGKRFWHSLQCRFGFTPNVFKYFTHHEVFDRISERCPNDSLRYCIDRGGSRPLLLAVTNPRTAAITHDDLQALLSQYHSEGVTYADGVVRSTHRPRCGGPFAIAGDQFQSRFVIDCPVDGFGRPAVYLSLLREICSNGAVAFTPAFRSELNTGTGPDGAQFALMRALDGFNNEEGFAALRQRFESATQSWASVNEALKLYKLLVRLHSNGHLSRSASVGGDGGSEVPEGSPLFRSFHRMTGDLSRLYGLANLDGLSVKRQRTLPAACRVYDVLNFVSELATHHARPEASRPLQAHLGQLVSAEYDLEGTAGQFADWQDFFVGNSATIETASRLR